MDYGCLNSSSNSNFSQFSDFDSVSTCAEDTVSFYDKFFLNGGNFFFTQFLLKTVQSTKFKSSTKTIFE